MSTVAEPSNQRLTAWDTSTPNTGFGSRGRRSVLKDASLPSFCKSNHKPHRICGVCGDRARSLHFGGLSCDSCKAFFRRAVQSGTYKTFQCPHQPGGWNKFCVITVASRKSCQKCRFEACVQIGMEISWVMSEAERQRLLISRMAKKRKLDVDMTQCSTPSSSTSEQSPPVLLHKSRPLQDYLWPLYPDNICVENFMSPSEAAMVEKVKTSWSYAMNSNPPTRLEARDLNKADFNHSEMVRAINGSIKRFQSFGRPLFGESEVLERDKTTILRSSMLDLCILRAALNHFRGAIFFERYFPTHLHEVHIRFVKGLQELSLDQTTILLFLVVILLCPDRPNLEQPQKVEKLQEYYLMLLYKYMVGRYGMSKASALYPKLLAKLTDIQELSDCHQEQYLLFADHEVQSVQQELNRINSSETFAFNMASSVENQQQLSPFDQIFSSPVPQPPPAPCEVFVDNASVAGFYPQSSPLSDPSSDAGYVSFEEKQGFYFDNMQHCGSINNTPQQGHCLPSSSDVQLQLPLQYQASQYNFNDKLPSYSEACKSSSVISSDIKTDHEFLSCLETSLSSNFSSSPTGQSAEEYFSSDFSSTTVFPIDDVAENSSPFFSVFNR